MGLDMYLWKIKREEVAYWRKANAIHAWFERKLAEDNREINNCSDYYVTKENLIELRDTCQTILDNTIVKIGNVKNGERLNKDTGNWEPIYEQGKVIDNPELAQEMLPTQSGFFFGSTDYDEHYINELESTISQINKILETTDFDNESIAYSAWW